MVATGDFSPIYNGVFPKNSTDFEISVLDEFARLPRDITVSSINIHDFHEHGTDLDNLHGGRFYLGSCKILRSRGITTQFKASQITLCAP